jgi:hypothetical protein
MSPIRSTGQQLQRVVADTRDVGRQIMGPPDAQK